MVSDVKHPKVSIVIPCRNEEKYIKKNVQSILDQDYKGEIEVLVVDGMSTDNTRSIITEFTDPSVRLIDNPAQFTPQALNIGIKESEGEIFIILGGHAYLSEDFVSRNVDHILNIDGVGCTGGVIENIHENKASELISDAMSSKFGVGNATFRTGGKASFVDTVAFGAYVKSIVDDIGYFDEDLIRNQDDEYNFRVTKNGYKIYFDPKIISYYYVRGSFKKLFKQYYQYGYWKVYVNKKHKAITTIRQLIPLFLVLGLILGGVLSLLVPKFWMLFSAGVAFYVFCSLFFGFNAAKHKSQFLKVSMVFPVLHISYGWGYLRGIIDFLVLNKKPKKRAANLTR